MQKIGHLCKATNNPQETNQDEEIHHSSPLNKNHKNYKKSVKPQIYLKTLGKNNQIINTARVLNTRQAHKTSLYEKTSINHGAAQAHRVRKEDP